MIKNYNQFLLESILFASKDFIRVLDSISDVDPIANSLRSLIGVDINTQYNGLDISNQDGKVNFTNDRQFQSLLGKMDSEGAIRSRSSSGNQIDIGRLAGGILRQNSIDFKQVELERFVNRYKAAWKALTAEQDKIRIVRGEEIRKWYHQRNYCMETLNGKGTLGNSCMRHPNCQPYFDIYTENPDVCQMLILTDIENGEEVLLARALIWKTDKGLYLDRIYYTQDSQQNLLENWAKKNLGCNIFWSTLWTRSPRLEVSLQTDSKRFDKYPYIDSLPYHNLEEGTLQNWVLEGGVDGFECQKTDGTVVDLSGVLCEYINQYYPLDDVVWSNYYESYLPEEECERNESMQDWVYRPEAVEVWNEELGQSEWYPEDSKLIIWVQAPNSSGSDYFLKRDCVLMEDDWYHKSYVVVCHEVNPSDLQKFKDIYGIKKSRKNKFWIDEVGAELFGIKSLGEGWPKTSLHKYEYFDNNYTEVIYDEFEKKIEQAKDKPHLREEMLKQLEEANEHFDDTDCYYMYNNLLHEESDPQGLLAEILDDFNAILDYDYEKGKTIFDLVYDEVSKYGTPFFSEKGSELKTKIREQFSTNLIEILKNIQENYTDPDEYTDYKPDHRPSGIRFKTGDARANYFLVRIILNSIEVVIKEDLCKSHSIYKSILLTRFFVYFPEKIPV